MTNELSLSREAWSNREARIAYVDYLLERDLIEVDNCENMHVSNRAQMSRWQLEYDTMIRIHKLHKLPGYVAQYPIWEATYNYNFDVPDPNWEEHCVTYAIVVKERNHTEFVLTPFELPPQPFMLDREKLHEGFSFLDDVFATIEPGKTKYDNLINRIFNVTQRIKRKK